MKAPSRSSRGTKSRAKKHRGELLGLLNLNRTGSRILSFESLEVRRVLAAPEIFSLNPPDNSINVPTSPSQFVMTFDQPILRGQGSLEIRRGSDHSTVQTVPIGAVNILGSTATFNTDLLAEGTEYYVLAAPTPIRGVFTNSAGENFLGLTSRDHWNFTTADHTNPIVVSLSPANSATGVPIASDLVINFNEPIRKGDGVVQVFRSSSPRTLFEEIPVADGRVEVNGATVTIDTRPFEQGTAYYVVIPPSAFEDLAGNDFAGINFHPVVITQEWQFTTRNDSGDFVVNSVDDLPDIAPGDGVADDGTGHTTLRAAIMEANALVTPRKIRVPAGNYFLSHHGPDDNAAFGDLDITSSLTIMGDGANTTVINGLGLDRVFHVHPTGNVKLSKLTIRNGDSSLGGGVNNQGTLAIDNVVVTQNSAGQGGGIYSETPLTIINSSLTENRASTGGGAVFSRGALTIDKAYFTNNNANDGGAIYSEGVLSIASSSMVSNLARRFGGALYNRLASTTILNSTIGDNVAERGGGGWVTVEGGTTLVTSSTIHLNRAPFAGGIGAENANVALKNTIVAGNIAETNPDLFGASYTSLGNNIVGNPSDVPGFVDGTNGDQVGSNAQPLNPQLGPAGQYGGPILVYPLLPNSPAIDRGNNTGVTVADQLGNERVVDGDDDGVATIDVGAVEYQSYTFIVNSFDDNPDILLADGIAADVNGQTTLRAAIMEANSLPGRATIRVPSGTYRLTTVGENENGAARGDLDIANRLTIIGNGADSTIIDGVSSDSVFHVLPAANVKLSKLTIRNGVAPLGGGINNQGILAIDNVAVTQNGAGQGGGIYSQSPLTIIHSSLTENRASAGGGAVFSRGALTIDKANFTNNNANDGGAIYSEGVLSIKSSSMVSNLARRFGGALYNRLASTTILNSTIGDNVAERGGGGLVTVEGGTTLVSSSTIHLNRAPFSGGIGVENANVALKNTIVAGNIAETNPDLFGASFTSLGNNFVGNPSDVPGFVDGVNSDQVGSNAQPLNPQLGPAGQYGGPTIVYPLLLNSPAIDRGNSTGATITDQLGKERVVDGDDDGTDIIDIGSVEYQPFTFLVNSDRDLPDAFVGDGIAEDSTGKTTLRAAIMEANAMQSKVRIRVPSGTYILDVLGFEEDSASHGDLDIARPLTIVGAGADSTIIDGGGFDRVFHLHSGTAARISKLTIRNGKAHFGGGLLNQGTLTLDNVQLTENRANDGGAIYNAGMISIASSSLVKNRSDNIGGAIYNHLATLTMFNSTIGDNLASLVGGGLATDGGDVTLLNATVYKNNAVQGGGIAVAIDATISLKNSIVAGNAANNKPDLYGTNYTSLGNNIIGTPSEGLGFINGSKDDQVGTDAQPLDPQLGLAGTYGGTTIVYPLLPVSPAIDHGNNIGAKLVDQLGNARIADGDDDGTAVIDIGAVEFQPLTFIVNSNKDLPDVLPGDGVAQDATGLTTLRAAIMEANTIQVPVRIRLPADTYMLDKSGQDDTATLGDLDIARMITIVGDGADTTFIDGGGLDRVFDVLPGAAARLSKVSIRHGDAQLGGGIRNLGNLAIDKVSLAENMADRGGGVYSENTLTIFDSSIFKNNATLGGAIYSRLASATILNSTIGENVATSGGGGLVTVEGGTTLVTNSTIHLNRAPIAGGLAVGVENANVALKNTIVAGNIADTNPEVFGRFTSLGNNLIGNSSDAVGFINGMNNDLVGTSSSPLDPRLGIAGTYGGSTFLYPLLPDSPAIDRGDNAGSTAKDQIGNARIADGDIDGTDTIDIGAIEFQPAVASFNAVGSNLSLDMIEVNANVSVVSAGTSYRLTLAWGTWKGSDSANVTGNGSDTLTVTTAGLLAFDKINITDLASGAKVTFNDSGANVYSDSFSVILDDAGAGAIQFIGTTAFTGANGLNASTTNGIYLSSGSSLSTVNGSLSLKASQLEGTSTTVTSVSGSITLAVDAINLTGTTSVQTADSVQIATRSAETQINLGGNDVVGTLGLTDAELDRISTGFLLIGNGISGPITVSAAITTNTRLSLVAGSGGILSGGGYLATSGASISLDTTGPIGTSSNRILVADQADTGRQRISVGASIRPSSVYLGGLGSLTLARILGGHVNTKIDITAVTNLVVAARATINSGTNSISLAADVAPNGTGDDGIGTLTIEPNANVQGSSITLVGADEVLNSSANIGNPLIGDPLLTALTGVSGPYAIALDGSGNVFVANTTGNTVSKFAPGATSPSATLTGLDRPYALAFDRAGNLFVANSNGTTVSKFLPGTTSPSATLTGLDKPVALAFDSNGNLFVANFGNGSGTTVSKFAPGSTTASVVLTDLNAPYALAFDPSGNLFVANYYGGKVSKFAPGSTTATALTGVDFPVALAIDSIGNLFVANYYNNTVSKFAPGALTPTATLQGLNHPNAFAIDTNDNLFVANYSGNSVSIFAPGATNPTATINQLTVPVALAFDKSDNLLVANYGTAGIGSTVNKYMTSIASTVMLRPSVNGRSIDVGSNTPNAFGVTDAELDRIASRKLVIGNQNSGAITVSAAITLNTNFELNSGSGGIVSMGGSLGTVGESITLNTSGAIGTSSNRLMFADQINTAKQKVFIGAGSPPGSVYLGGLGSLTLGGIAGGSRNATIDVTALTDLTVAEGATINSGTSRVSLGADLTMAGVGDDGVGKLTIGSGASVFGADITLVSADLVIDSTATVGSATAGNRLIATLDGMRGPYALAIDDSGNLFVGNNRFDGTTVSKFAPGATTPTDTLTGLSRPMDLAFDGSGNLYVANSENQYVSKFAPGTTRASAELSGVDAPTSLAFDKTGNLFVAGFGNGSGKLVHKFVPGATAPSETLEGLNAPFVLTFDDSGNLFVANYYGGSVSKFARDGTTATGLLNGLDFPVALAFDHNGNLFAANYYKNTVSMFSPGATTPTATLEGLDHPTALIFDGSGNLFVANYNGNTVSKFTPGATRPSETIQGLDVPVGFAFDRSGNLFVANYGTVGMGTTVSKFATSVAATNSVTIRPSIINRAIDLGSNTPNTLGLTDAELDRINAGTLRIGDSNSGKVTFGSPLSFAATSALVVTSGSDISQSFVGTALSGGASLVLQGNLSPALAGAGNFVVDGNTSFDALGSFKVNLNGMSAYDQLVLASNNRTINLGGATLVLALDSVPDIGEVFKIIDSTGTGSLVIGKFKYGGVTLNDGDIFAGGNTPFRINYNPAGGAGDVILTREAATVINQSVYYRGSSFSQSGTNVNAALDTSKSIAKPGLTPQTLNYANLVNTTRGINGMVLSVAGLTSTNLSAADFVFRMSPTGLFNEAANPPSSWAQAPAPSGIFVTLGTPTTPAQVRIEWDDNAIANRWLQLQVLANSRTGLKTPQVFYFGHLQGEVNGIVTGNAFFVTTQDQSAVLPLGSATVTNVRDLDKNGFVTTQDLTAVRNSITAGRALRVITVPASGSAPEGAVSGSPGDGTDSLKSLASLLGTEANFGIGQFFAVPNFLDEQKGVRNSVLTNYGSQVSAITPASSIATQELDYASIGSSSTPISARPSKSFESAAPTADEVDKVFEELDLDSFASLTVRRLRAGY